MTLDGKSGLDLFKQRLLNLISDLFLFSVRPDDIISTRVFFWTALYKFFEVGHVPWSYFLRNGKVHCNLFRNTNLVKSDHRIRRDNGSCTEIDTLTCKIVTDTSFFG